MTKFAYYCNVMQERNTLFAITMVH